VGINDYDYEIGFVFSLPYDSELELQNEPEAASGLETNPR